MGLAALRHKGEKDGIHSLEDLDEVIKEIGLLDVAIDQVNNEAHLQKIEIDEEAARRVNAYTAQREEILRLAETYVEAKRPELLQDKKSRSLNFGKFGFRKPTAKLEIPKRGTQEMESLVKLIDIMADNVPFSDIEVNTERFVKVNALKSLSDTELAKIGLKRIPGKDIFFVEPDRSKVTELELVSK